MPLNRSKTAVIEHRRRIVASLRLRGYTVREIQAALPKQDIINEKDGKDWAIGTIASDMKANEAAWKEAALIDVVQHKANVLAEVREARRAAWRADRIGLVLKALDDERKLFGLDAPTRSELSGPDGGAIEVNIGDIREQLIGRVNCIATGDGAGSVHLEHE